MNHGIAEYFENWEERKTLGLRLMPTITYTEFIYTPIAELSDLLKELSEAELKTLRENFDLDDFMPKFCD